MIKDYLMSDMANISNEEEMKRDQWFSDFISHLNADRFMLATNTASADTKKFYEAFINEDEVTMSKLVRQQTSISFIKRLIYDYLKELKQRKTPLRLAFSLSDSKILVWAEIENDDDVAEDALLLTEAKINAAYSEYGFYVDSTILEKRDAMTTLPPHFKSII
jgi:HEPN domain-containing protein